jgi:hypothetical protein
LPAATQVSSYCIRLLYCYICVLIPHTTILLHRWRRWSGQLPCGRSPMCRRRTYAQVLIYKYIYITCFTGAKEQIPTQEKLLPRPLRDGLQGLEARVSMFTGCTGAKVQILTQKALLTRPLHDGLPGLEARVSRCSGYLLYWHKSTNTDAEARVSSDVQADGICNRGHAASAAAAGAWPCHGALWGSP